MLTRHVPTRVTMEQFKRAVKEDAGRETMTDAEMRAHLRQIHARQIHAQANVVDMTPLNIYRTYGDVSVDSNEPNLPGIPENAQDDDK